MSINKHIRALVRKNGKENLDLVSLWEGISGVPKVGVFLNGKYIGTGFVSRETLNKLGIRLIRGKKRTKYLRSKGLLLDKKSRIIRKPKRRMRYV